MSNTPIMDLPVAVALTGSEYTPVVQGGTTKRAAASLFDFSGGSAGGVQDANTVYAGPTSGAAAAPSFRAIVPADFAGTVWPADQGGTGLSSYAIGDLIYADGATSLAKLAGVATGNALISGGVTTAPSWGKIGLTTHVDGTLPVANGGTGVASTTAYAVLTGGTTSTGALQSVASVGTTGQALLSNGAGALPSFQTLSSAVGAALTRVDDTNVTLTLGGSPTTSLLAATSLTLGWSGQLAPSRGGTGIASYAVGDLIYASGATTLAKLADVAVGRVLMSGGVGVAPAWGVVNFGDQTTANYATRTAAAAATIPAGITTIVTMGYATVGVGGATYITAGGSTTGGFQSADGAWWQLDVNPVTPAQLGAVTGSSSDQTSALQDWLDYAAANGARAYLDGSYRTDSGIVATGDGIYIYGNGNDVTNTGISPTELQTTNANVNGTMLALRGNNIVCRDFAIVGAGTRAISGGGRGLWIGDNYTTVTDGEMTLGSPTLTSASSVFSSANVGQYVRVAGAGTGGTSKTFGVLAAPTPTTLTLSANADATVSGATVDYGDVYRGIFLENISTSSNGVGIEFGACFESGAVACHLSDYDALKLNCRVAPDGGDCFFEVCHLSADAAAGKAVHILAGGGARFTNCKGLTTLDYFYIDWNLGISGGPLINGCSLENGSGRFLFVTGSGSEQLNGLQMQNCWLNSGATIVFDNVGSAWCHRVLLENNNIIGNGADSPVVDFGSSVDWFRMTGGMVDGNSGVVTTVAGAAVGIQIRSGATYGVIDGVIVKGCTTRISNSSTTTIVRDLTTTTQQFSGTAAVRITNTTDSASNPALTLDSDRATPANNDTVYQSYRLSNASGTQVEYARITVTARDVTAASEDGAIQFGVVNAGSLSQELYLSAGSLQPNINDGLTLGSNGAGWSDLYMASGAVVDFASGNWVATHTSGILTVGTGDLRVTTAGTNSASVVTVGGSQTLTSKTLTSPAINTGTVGTSLNPSSNDGAALGASGTAYSDLFLASGAVINFDASNVTITHAANKLTIAGVSSEFVVNGGGSGSSDVNIARFLSGAGGTQISFQNTGGTAASVSMGSTGGGNFDLQAAASRGLLVRKAGGIYTYARTGPVNACYDVAIPAGGTAGEGVTVSSTTNFGMFFGSGAPSLSAAQGSIYLRSDGSSSSTRLYVNTNGSTGWTNVTTAT